MKKSIFLMIAIFITFSYISFSADEDEKHITVGVVEYHINDGIGNYTWNGQENEDCRCWNGNDMNCWFEKCESVNTDITYDPTDLTHFDFTGNLNPIDVTVSTPAQGDINLQAQSNNFTVPESHFIIPYDDFIPGLDEGDIIDFPQFTTDETGNYSVTGILR